MYKNSGMCNSSQFTVYAYSVFLSFYYYCAISNIDTCGGRGSADLTAPNSVSCTCAPPCTCRSLAYSSLPTSAFAVSAAVVTEATFVDVAAFAKPAQNKSKHTPTRRPEFRCPR